MQAEDRVGLETLKQAVRQHGLGAGADLFRGLEDEMQRSVELAGARQTFGRGEQDGGVTVMAASMHDAVAFAGVRQAGRLADRQRVHVGAEGERPPATSAQGRDDPGAADARRHLVAPFPEPPRDALRGALFLP